MADHPGIDFDKVHAARERALALLRRSYKDSPAGGGGWYHQLDSGGPGATATSVVLLAFWRAKAACDQWDDALEFLVASQNLTEDSLQHGGWPVTTSFGRPVLEATAWVGRLLGTSRLVLNDKAPDAMRVLKWLTNNQNEDGGWGSIRGHPSRVYQTCLAVQAVRALAPHHSRLDAATTWLMDSRDPATGGWGAVRGAPPTIVHTSWTLETLATARAFPSDALSSYDWLFEVLDPNAVTEHRADVESYNIHLGKDVLQGTLWHTALPRAMSALARHPEGPQWDLLARTARTVIAMQGTGGTVGAWPNPGAAAGISVWAVFPYIEALTDLLECPAIAQRVRMQPYGNSLILSTDSRDVSPGHLVMNLTGRELWRRVRTRWTTTLLACIVLTAITLTMIGSISIEIGLIGIIFPIFLFLVQEIRAKATARNE